MGPLGFKPCQSFPGSAALRVPFECHSARGQPLPTSRRRRACPLDPIPYPPGGAPVMQWMRPEQALLYLDLETSLCLLRHGPALLLGCAHCPTLNPTGGLQASCRREACSRVPSGGSGSQLPASAGCRPHPTPHPPAPCTPCPLPTLNLAAAGPGPDPPPLVAVHPVPQHPGALTPSRPLAAVNPAPQRRPRVPVPGEAQGRPA